MVLMMRQAVQFYFRSKYSFQHIIQALNSIHVLCNPLIGSVASDEDGELPTSWMNTRTAHSDTVSFSFLNMCT